MTTELRDEDDVRAWLAENVYAPTAEGPHPEKVGLEAELFPFWLTPDGRPAGRMALVELVGIIDDIDGAVRNPSANDGRPSWQLDGTLITEEPGAQLEVAGPPDEDVDAAMHRVETVIGKLSSAFSHARAGLAATGLDCWSDDDELPVQLGVPRYEAMTSYWAMRGEAQGNLMMCSACSLQVNVDLGPPQIAQDRWLLANLAAPVVTAVFATSPVERAVNGRALGWRGLDPTRTGIAPPLIAGCDDPVEHVLADALRADVMLLQRDGRTVTGRPGWRFGDWVHQPHKEHGPPTTDDLALHLTTLFPENRLRGFIEVRGVDALPARWRSAAVAIVVGLLYDADATAGALELLAPHRPEIPDLLDRAARAGLNDPVVGRLSRGVVDLAVEGAQRQGWTSADAAGAFAEEFVHHTRHPSDELRRALDKGPATAFAWARS